MKKALLIGLAALVVTFGAGYLVATQILFPPLPEPENGIVVPNLAGKLERQARSDLHAAGLELGDALEFAHPDQPPGIIVAQSPLAGQQLRQGGIVRVGMSAGLPRVLVPDVIGFDVARATAVLSQLGLTADQSTEQSDRPAGTVLRISPEVGQRQPVPARVLLVVSAGPPPDSVRTPQPMPPADSTTPGDTLVSRTGD